MIKIRQIEMVNVVSLMRSGVPLVVIARQLGLNVYTHHMVSCKPRFTHRLHARELELSKSIMRTWRSMDRLHLQLQRALADNIEIVA
jgi:hypothetical protein